MAHGRAVTSTEVEHGLALAGQQPRRVSLGTQHPRSEFGPVGVPAAVLLTGELAQGFPIDCGTGDGVSSPEGSAVEKNGGRQFLRAPLPPFFATAHVNTLSTTGRRVLVSFTKVFHTLFHLRHLILTPGLTVKGVHLGGNTDLSGEHSSDFPTYPSR